VISANGGSNGHIYPNVIEGVIESRNDKGIKVNGDWFNVSQFRPVELPDVGVVVRIKVQPKGFINSLEVIRAMPDDGTPAVSSSNRDERITRLAVLKAAANFVGLWGQSREEIKSDHVLLLADKWLAWINQ
jgi:hypothetical protein